MEAEEREKGTLATEKSIEKGDKQHRTRLPLVKQ